MKLMIVGEAWGEKEAEVGKPFVGTSGWFLDQCLSQVGIDRRDCYVTNVFNLRPNRNEVLSLCGPRADGIPGLPELAKGKYVRREYAKELERLYNEVKTQAPNAILALGPTAAWAFLGTSGIKAIRGAVAPSQFASSSGGLPKVVPTYHPSAVMRDMSLRPILISDMDKVKREAAFPELNRPRREIWIRPTIADLAQFETLYLKGATLVSADIETRSEQITCFGFSPRPDVGIVIPFILESNASYWSHDDELTAWAYVRRWLAEYPTVFQNGMYDMHFSWRKYGLPTPKAAEDTMLLHHAWQPEMEKGLGFLATLYTDEASWKFMRKGSRHD